MKGLETAYRRLGAVAASLAGAADAREMGQDMLDFLAVLGGLKPVLLVGRGLDEPRWVAGVLGVARSLDLAVTAGPLWSAGGFPAGAPGWYADHVNGTLAARHAWYVTFSPDAAEEVAAIGRAGGRVTTEQEARLLGYPLCCVDAHYVREESWHRLVLDVLDRLAEGDDARMQKLLANGLIPAPETDAERALHATATDIRPCAFTSWNMCDGCAGDPTAPSAALSARYRALAQRFDAELAALLRPG